MQRQEDKAVNLADDLSQSSGASLSHDSKEASDNVIVKKGGTTPTEQMQALFMSRLIVGFLLAIVAISAGATAFFVATRTQEEYLDNQVSKYPRSKSSVGPLYHYFVSLSSHSALKINDASRELINSANGIMENALAVFATMSSTISGLATAADWPFYTQTDFEALGQSFLQGSGADLVSWSPIIRGEEQRRLWGNYSSSNDGWVEQGLAWQAANQGLDMPSGPFDVPQQIYTKHSAGVQAPEVGSGPFAPVWQMAGAPTDPSVVNFNLISDDVFRISYEATVNDGVQTLSKIIPDASWYYGKSAMPEVGSSVPQALLISPLFSDTSTSTVVGIVVSVFTWDTYFKNVLLQGTPKLYVVIDAEKCGETFTLGVNGREVSYLGTGDLHEKAYSDNGVSADFATDQTAYLGCAYSISVYPSKEFVETYQNREPAFWTLFMVGILILISIVFFVYDLFVQKRQFKYLTSAAKSNAIVSSLFPEEVRDRLFGKDNNAGKNEENHFPESSKFRLRHYLSTESGHVPEQDEESIGNMSASERISEQKEMAVPNAQVGVDMYQTKPIADLFPNTTIMFADIAGFTAWSSVREPSQVFTLLENVYSAFDAVAKRRKVFKVETVG